MCVCVGGRGDKSNKDCYKSCSAVWCLYIYICVCVRGGGGGGGGER